MQTNGNGERSIRFGSFELKLRSGELCRDGSAIKLPPQPFKVLVFLVEHAGQLVTREEIQQQIWGDTTYVDFDKGLNFCIKQIREALGDNAQSPVYIETLPRRGYRFIAPVSSHESASELIITTSLEDVKAQSIEYSDPDTNIQIDQVAPQSTEANALSTVNQFHITRRRAAIIALAILLPLVSYIVWNQIAHRASTSSEKIMLAVLPFENLNQDSEEDYFSDGLTEEMIAQLGRLRPQRLGVIARTTALTYKKTDKDIRQIGRELGVSFVLEGSVRREADRVRITAQLIQVSDQTHLWADTFERSERDLITIQSEVASRVARSLALELLPAQESNTISNRTTQPEVYEAYLKGRYLIIKDTLEDFERSIPYFEQAIKQDPNFAPAYVGATQSRVFIATWRNLPAAEVLPKAKADALKAVELDPLSAEAYAALASVNFWLEWNWADTERNIKRSIELNPSDPHAHILYGNFLLTRGQVEAGIAEVKQGLELDPVSLLTNGLSAYFYLRARQYDDAIVQGKKMLELEPRSPAGHHCLQSAYIFKGMYKEALDVIRENMVFDGFKQEEIDSLTKGDPKEAITNLHRQSLEHMKESLSKGRKVSASSFAYVYASLGEKDQALEWLEKSIAARESSSVYFFINPFYDYLRSDSRFNELARQAGLS
jgi:TolB-like protein/DNA-binding winged helix-turn-helix (wHTH) protein